MLIGLARKIVRRLRGDSAPAMALRLSKQDQAIADRCSPYTMTGPERMAALLDSVEYIVKRNIPGAFAECGVWRGGSIMAIVLKLQELGVTDRDIYLYDTFEGMTAPTAVDVSPYHQPALKAWNQAKQAGKKVYDQYFNDELFSEDMVREVLYASGYPKERFHFVRGPVEQTIPANVPTAFSLIRLDTDWYESTKHELEHLYPLLSKNGVLIIDDYGHWLGSQRATDEYFSKAGVTPVLLTRVDYTARLVLKP